MNTELFIGPFIHALRNYPETKELEIFENGAILVVDGKIKEVAKDLLGVKQIQLKYNLPSEALHILKDFEFMVPGFVDTHIHAPQYANSGLGLDLPLLQWLEKYTFPLEQKFGDVAFADEKYRNVVKRTLSCGSTTASYYATIHLESCKKLSDIVEEYGQRALVGKVNMDRNSPDSYIENTEQSLADTEEFIKYVLEKKNSLVKPVITPRFAIACTDNLMKELGKLARKYNIHIQSHLSENEDEVKFTKELYPKEKDYTSVYDAAGLLTSKTIMAHSVYLTKDEIKKLQERKSSIAHCPLSNICLVSGFFNFHHFGWETEEKGTAVGLGTDVAGGYSPSILNIMRSAIETSKILYINKKIDKENILNINDAFYLATLGGAKGSFEEGKSFDALRVNLKCHNSPIHANDGNIREQFQQFIMLGDDRNITHVYVDGIERKSTLI